MNFFAGQKVITTSGVVRTIAYIDGDKVFAYSLNGGIERITPRYEAWGGEVDPEIRNAA
jgi:hypothetical protein